jgi:hypothetical protein
VRYALLGALLIVGGIAAQIEAARHRPSIGSGPGRDVDGLVFSGPSFHLGWSSTAYDAVRICGWPLIIFGAVIIVFALVRELRRAPVVGQR